MSLNLLHALHKNKHQLLAVTTTWTDGEFSRRLTEIGVPEVRLPMGVLSKRLSLRAMWWTANAMVRAPQLWFRWHRTRRRFQPDIMILTNPKQGLWLYPWMDNQPTFLIEHSLKAISRANTWMYAQLNKRLSGFVAVSKFMAEHLQRLGVPPKSIRVIYNCSGNPSVDAIRKRGDDSWVIGIVGQIARHKGHDLLLAAAELLNAQGVPFKVVVYGGGETDYLTELKRKIARAGLDSVWHWMSYSSVQDAIYKNIDILVVPSMFEEPFGMVALEALRRGIAVIAARCGGLPEIIQDGVTGLLIEPGQADELARKIQSLIENPDVTYLMGVAGRKLVARQFTEEKMVTDFENLFRDVLSNRGSAKI